MTNFPATTIFVNLFRMLFSTNNKQTFNITYSKTI